MKHTFILIVLLILLGIVYIFRSAFSVSAPTSVPTTPIATSTTPTQPVNEKVILHLNESILIAHTTLKAWAVTQDSRCPSDVRCIQAGKVTVAVNITGSSDNLSRELEPGMTVTTEALSITLDDVTPYPISTHKITDGEYQFVFTVKGK